VKVKEEKKKKKKRINLNPKNKICCKKGMKEMRKKMKKK